jgi:hypothetical protein
MWYDERLVVVVVVACGFLGHIPSKTNPLFHIQYKKAGDVLTAREVADAFGQAQGTPCVHTQNRLLSVLARLFFRDLYEIIRFYRRSTETTDIAALQEEFPGLTTSFAEFLQETAWSNRSRTFQDLSNIL